MIETFIEAIASFQIIFFFRNVPDWQVFLLLCAMNLFNSFGFEMPLFFFFVFVERIAQLLDGMVDRVVFGSLEVRVRSSVLDVVVVFELANLTVVGVRHSYL